MVLWEGMSEGKVDLEETLKVDSDIVAYQCRVSSVLVTLKNQNTVLHRICVNASAEFNEIKLGSVGIMSWIS